MPRPTRAQGRPGTTVIPTAWEAGHQPVVAKTFTATCALREPGTRQDWDDDLEQNLAVPNDPYWTGSARIQSLATQAREVVVAGDPETVVQYLVVVDAAAGSDDYTPTVGDLVTITAAGDPLLVDAELRVVQVVLGSLRFERDLFCVIAD